MKRTLKTQKNDDTSDLVGGPIQRNGAKGRIAQNVVRHFAKARVYGEPYFGAGSIFYRLMPGTYEREAINDINASIMTFFRVLRDRTEELVRVCELSPYARDEFIVCLEKSEDELEEARRVWVRHRQGFSGRAKTPGDWGRNPGYSGGWNPHKTETKLALLRTYGARLRGVSIDAIDSIDFVNKWGQEKTFLYEDPPYLPGTCADNTHEDTMSVGDHCRLAAANHAAVERGTRVAISGYPSALYDRDLYPTWRRVEKDVALHGARDTTGVRRTEVLWMSYPESEEITYRPRGTQMSFFDSGFVDEEPAHVDSPMCACIVCRKRIVGDLQSESQTGEKDS